MNINLECNCGIFIYFFIYLQGEDISSFLFRYPISKLTPAEAAQVRDFKKTTYMYL